MTPRRLGTLIFILIFIGGVIVGVFGLRTLHAFREVRGHRPPPPRAEDSQQIETDVEMIREWMTIPYISKTYQVPANVLFDALGIPAEKNREKSLKRLNKEYFPGANGYVLEKIKATVLAALANQNQSVPKNPETPVIPVIPTSAP